MEHKATHGNPREASHHFTKEEALAFVESMRLTISGKVGFKWMTEKLAALADYIDEVTSENERMSTYIDSIGARDAFDEDRSE